MNLTSWLTKGGWSLRARALWASFFALIALSLRLAAPAPPPRTAEGVATMLEAAVGGSVRPDDFIWEERGGFFSDAFLGRKVLFLARRPDPAGGAGAGDLFRARVRLTRAGRPVSLHLVQNLTESPLGDDRDLVAHGRRAAFLTMAAGAVQGISLLDLDGEGDAREAKTRSERIGASIESFLSSGSFRGVGRTEISFAPTAAPGALPSEAKLELAGDLLVMALGKEALPAALDLRDGSLNTGPRNPFAARAQRIPHLRKPLADVAIEVVQRAWGPRPAGALQALIAPPRPRAPRGPQVVFPGREPPPAPADPGSAPSSPGGDWPPPALSPRVEPPLAGEGVWAPPAPAFASVAAGPGAPSPFFETAVRPDPRRPEALVRLVAIDLRQLDLRLEAGFDSPRPATGIRGAGRLPIDVPVVAAFTAGPAQPAALASPGVAPGFIVDRRLLVPPAEGLATVALAQDGRPLLGAWPFGPELPAGIASLAQGPDPLLGGEGAGKLPLVSGAALAERSALCQVGSGQMIYAWAAEVDAGTLTAALSMAGCSYAVPLAASPAPTGFAYLHNSAAAAPAGWEAARIAPEMSLSSAQLAGASPNPLFYAVRRDPRPTAPVPAGEARSSGGGEAPGWAPDAGPQPTPAWLPAIYGAVVSNLGAQIHLTSFAPGRLLFRIQAGGKEPATKAAAALPGAIGEADLGRVLAAIGIGAGRKKGAKGLAIGGAVGYPFRAEGAAGVLVMDKGKPAIGLAAGFTPPPGADATELPLTADEGKLRPEAREVGSMRPRAVACVLEDGTFVVGATTFDSDEAATGILLELGCTRVVALDRGAHNSAFFHRAQAETPPSARYEASAIYAIDAPLQGRARRLGSD